MLTITRKTWPHATGSYLTQPDSTTLCELLKPRRLPGKPRPRAEVRYFPKADDGRSTRDYVAAYWRLNSIHAPADVLALYEPLSTARQYAPADPIVEEVTA